MFHVKPVFDNNKFFCQLLDHGIDVTAEQSAKIDHYCELIKIWSKRKNLVSRPDLDRLMERHVAPSIYVSQIIKNDSGARMADIGSGAGFLGIIIKIFIPQISICLIDSSRKKYLFLVEACEALNIDCNVIHERVEKASRFISQPLDLIVCRGVAPLHLLWSWSKPLLKKTGTLYALKGGNIDQEIEKLEKLDLSISIIKPDGYWSSLSDVLNDKCVISLRSNYGRK